jgi:hypothetical protein
MSGDEVAAMDKTERAIAKGAPADLSPDALRSLSGGERSAAADRLIASQPLYTVERREGVAKSRFGPVAISAEELRLLATGEPTPESVLKKFEKAAKQKGRFGEDDDVRVEKERPSEKASEK